MTARALLVAGGLLLGLTACTSTVAGTATGPSDSPTTSPAPGTPQDSTATADPGATGGGRTVSCHWTPDESGNPELVDAAEPPATVPATGTVSLRMSTGQGELTLVLDRAGAPCAAAALDGLARQGFFDGTPCHRETDSPGLQVLQCGDPTGTGSGGPRWQYPTDVDGTETYPRGTVAMANSGSGTDGSQFFLVWGRAELSPDYTVVGTVDDGLAVLDAIAAQGNDGSNGTGDGAPTRPVTIESMTAG